MTDNLLFFHPELDLGSSFAERYPPRHSVPPLKRGIDTQNLANVFGLVLGGILLTLLGHIGFFALFGVLLVCAFVLTIKWRKSLLLSRI